MTPLRRLTPLLLLAFIPLVACGRTGPGQTVEASATVPNVGIAPERPVAAAAVPAVPAATTTQPGRATTTQPEAETTEPASTEPDETDPDDTEAIATGAFETDPARREWLEFTEGADPDSFAGGAALADIVDGNRVLMIGDSVMASTSSRYGGEMCDSVVTSGWDVEVDAETGRFIDFGDKVLDQRLDAGFDVVVIMLGNNYGANPAVFAEYLRDLVDRIDDRPVILSTVTVFQPNRMEVNNIVYDIAQDFETIRVLDWAGETEENASLTGGDGLHLSDLGRARFSDMVADELGDAPGTGREGDCLRSSFTDDSVGQGNTGPVEGQVTMPSNSIPSNTGGANTQPRPTVPGTAGSTVPESTTPGGGTGGTTPPGPTSPTVPQTPPPTVPPTQATPPPTVPPTQPLAPPATG